MDLRELAGEHTSGGGCGSIGFNARNFTREDSRMRVTLKGLPDKLRSAAWPSPVRAVRCPVKLFRKKSNQKLKSAVSQETNETRATSCYCLPRQAGTLAGPLALSQRKERSTAGQYTAEVEKPATFIFTQS